MEYTAAIASAAPTLVMLGDRQYQLNPLSGADMGAFERWVQTRYLALVKEQTADLRTEERERLLDNAFARAAAITFSSPQAIQALLTLEGATYALWLGLKRSHPELTLERVRDLLIDPKTIDAAMERFADLNRLPGAEKKTAPPNPAAYKPPKPKRRRRRA